MSVKIVNISNSDTDFLIELYREEQCLWDSSNAHYLDADLRQAALNRIAAQLGQEGVTGGKYMSNFTMLSATVQGVTASTLPYVVSQEINDGKLWKWTTNGKNDDVKMKMLSKRILLFAFCLRVGSL